MKRKGGSKLNSLLLHSLFKKKGTNINSFRKEETLVMSLCGIVDKTKTYPLSELFYTCNQIHLVDLLNIWCLVLSSFYKRKHTLLLQLIMPMK